MRRSCHLTSPSAHCLVRGVFAGCYQPRLLAGSSRRYCLRVFPRMSEPCPGGPTECPCLVLPQCHRPSPGIDRVGFPLLSANATFHGGDFGAAAISLRSGLLVCLPPGSLLPLSVSQQVSCAVYILAELRSL